MKETARNNEPLGKRLRFEVFERDKFTCQYCGKQPPDVMLHVDHIIPRAAGGSNDPENLRTSCMACNIGKADKPIAEEVGGMDGVRRAQEALESVDIAEKFARAMRARQELRDAAGAFLCSCLQSKDCLESSVTSLVQAQRNHSAEDVMKWFETAASVTAHHGVFNEVSAMKYFHGILRRVRERAGAE